MIESSNLPRPRAECSSPMTKRQCQHFAARMRSGQRSPGLLLALPRATVGEIVEALLIIWSSSLEEELADQIHYLPSLSRHLFR